MALTCVIGKNKVLSTDYSKEELRKWSDKGILMCDCCDTQMIYKHGDFKIPHFAHKSANCELQYSEPESEEHINGKLIIYNWLKTQNVSNLELESWIPETKQRPDIYFEKDGERFVIEFQCTPIATEFNERRKLYKLANIKDIWILGFNNYGFYNCENRNFNHFYNYKTKAIERELFNTNGQVLYLNNENLIGYNKLGFKKTTEVVEVSFDMFSENIFDTSLEELMSTSMFGVDNIFQIKTSIKRNKILWDNHRYELNILNARYKFNKLIDNLSLKEFDVEVFGECERLISFCGEFKILFRELMDIDRLIKNKTYHRKLKRGNYIFGDKIVVVEGYETRTFWNWDKKKHRKVPSESHYIQKRVYSIDTVCLDDLIKED